MSFVMAGVALTGAGVSYFSNRKKKKAAEREQAKAKAQMEKQRAAFESADITNPFANMENTMEDLTVNQQEAQMINQQGQQQRANIMDQMSQQAGGSGIAALAQQMAQQGELASQKSSASIGQQEAANQKAAAQQAAALQTAEATGEQTRQQKEMDRQSTLLGMDQAAYAGAQERTAAAEAAQMEALQSGLSSVGSIAQAGMSDRKVKKNIELIGNSPSGLGIYTFEYKDKTFGEGRYQGTMSDEVPEQAIIKHESGYDMVDYSKVDVEFKSIK